MFYEMSVFPTNQSISVSQQHSMFQRWKPGLQGLVNGH